MIISCLKNCTVANAFKMDSPSALSLLLSEPFTTQTEIFSSVRVTKCYFRGIVLQREVQIQRKISSCGQQFFDLIYTTPARVMAKTLINRFWWCTSHETHPSIYEPPFGLIFEC